jgi:hypothetical protein
MGCYTVVMYSILGDRWSDVKQGFTELVLLMVWVYLILSVFAGFVFLFSGSYIAGALLVVLLASTVMSLSDEH